MYPHARKMAADLEAAQSKQKPYKIGVSGGLYVYITPSGGKYWRYKYRIGPKERTLALGVFPAVSVPDAYAAHRLARLQLENGQDPCALKAAERKERAKPTTRHDSFRMAFLAGGALEIETATRLIRLTPAQAEVLRTRSRDREENSMDALLFWKICDKVTLFQAAMLLGNSPALI